MIYTINPKKLHPKPTTGKIFFEWRGVLAQNCGFNNTWKRPTPKFYRGCCAVSECVSRTSLTVSQMVWFLFNHFYKRQMRQDNTLSPFRVCNCYSQVRTISFVAFVWVWPIQCCGCTKDSWGSGLRYTSNQVVEQCVRIICEYITRTHPKSHSPSFFLHFHEH